MAQFTFGPVEFYLVGLTEDRPAPAIMTALTELIDAGTVRLLDLLLLAKSADGELTVTEIHDRPEDFGLAGVEFVEAGITGDEDVEELSTLVKPGTSAMIAVLELTWAKTLAEKLAAAGGEVLSVERIPAAIVNALVDSVDEDNRGGTA